MSLPKINRTLSHSRSALSDGYRTVELNSLEVARTTDHTMTFVVVIVRISLTCPARDCEVSAWCPRCGSRRVNRQGNFAFNGMIAEGLHQIKEFVAARFIVQLGDFAGQADGGVVAETALSFGA